MIDSKPCVRFSTYAMWGNIRAKDPRHKRRKTTDTTRQIPCVCFACGCSVLLTMDIMLCGDDGEDVDLVSRFIYLYLERRECVALGFVAQLVLHSTRRCVPSFVDSSHIYGTSSPLFTWLRCNTNIYVVIMCTTYVRVWCCG